MDEKTKEALFKAFQSELNKEPVIKALVDAARYELEQHDWLEDAISNAVSLATPTYKDVGELTDWLHKLDIAFLLSVYPQWEVSAYDDLAIWWLSQASTEAAIVKIETHPLPEYLDSELHSRYGRPGRGRLWVPEGIKITEIKWPADNPIAMQAEECGGIVFYRKDLGIVKSFPGFVTDLEFKQL